jgi:histidine triad (HIT) family protein
LSTETSQSAEAVAAQLNGPAAGQSVFHLHFHVLPRHEGLDLRFHARGMADPALLAAHAEKVRAALD